MERQRSGRRIFWVQLILLALCTQTVFGSSWLDRLMKQSPPKKPTIVYDRYEEKSRTFESINVEFIFIVDNPNKFGLDRVSLDYEFFLEGHSTASGKDVKVKIKPDGKTELRIPLTIKYVQAFKSTQALIRALIQGKKTIPFTFDIACTVDLQITKIRIPAQAKGDLPLPKWR